MAGEMIFLIIATIRPGKEKDLEALAHRAASWTKGNEPGVREYTWRLSRETGDCAVEVKIASAEAAGAYLNNFAKRFQEHFLEYAEIGHTLVVGHTTPPIRKKLEALKPVYMADTASFVRTTPGGASLMQ